MNPTPQIQVTDEIMAAYESRILGSLRNNFFDNLSDRVVVFTESIIFENNLHLLDLILQTNSSELINGVIVDGDLIVKGCLSNYKSMQQDSDLICNGRGVHLLVTGDMRIDNLISTQSTITVLGDFTAQQAVYLFYGDGSSIFGIGGQARIPVMLVNDEHEVWLEDDATNIGMDFDLYEADYGEVCEALVDEVLGTDDTKIEHYPLIEHLEANKNILRNPYK
jgi:hypothetical protein